MKTPKSFIQDNILVPAYQFRKNYISRSAVYSCCNKVANFIFDKSKETALIMLVFNAVSIMSSHIAQIRGLKKSKRENKDYLITQEWQEMGLDLLFTIIPPFMLNNYLMKKLDSGQWTTKSARDKLLYTITPTVGVAKEELYNTSHIKPVRETVGSIVAQATNKLHKVKNLPECVEKAIKYIEKNPNVRLPDPNKAIPMASMEDITTDFDVIRKRAFKGFYNGSAYDDISGQRNGMLILATLGYTILASAIITPILKNKLANRSYERRLKKMNETPDSLKRKQRFDYVNHSVSDNSDVFGSFLSFETAGSPSVTLISANEDISKIEKIKSEKQTPFSKFNTFSSISQSQSGLRI